MPTAHTCTSPGVCLVSGALVTGRVFPAVLTIVDASGAGGGPISHWIWEGCRCLLGRSLAIYRVTLEAGGACVVKQSCNLPELHTSCEGELTL